MQADHLQKGDLSEAKVSTKLIELGYLVSDTRGQAPYDLVADLADGGLKRVQVKSIRETENGLGVHLSKCGWSSKEDYYRDEYEDSEVDAFAIYDDIHGNVYWLWKGEAPQYRAERTLSTWKEDLIGEKL